ncbi:2-octaprenyl-6-methoxyphenol hydroxylase, partial [Lasius niger]
MHRSREIGFGIAGGGTDAHMDLHWLAMRLTVQGAGGKTLLIETKWAAEVSECKLPVRSHDVYPGELALTLQLDVFIPLQGHRQVHACLHATAKLHFGQQSGLMLGDRSICDEIQRIAGVAASLQINVKHRILEGRDAQPRMIEQDA